MYAFDMEVFAHDWLVVFKEIKTGNYTIIHNDNYQVKEFMKRDPLLVGFNNKYYDNHILKAIMLGADNALVKEINDFIISGGFGWDHWFVRNNTAYLKTFDIRDDMQKNLSLKAIEGHLGMDIEESSVPFDLARALTTDELNETISYCKHDVDMVEELVKLRKDYLKGKLALGKMKGIPVHKALYSTNAKMTALFLDATPKEHLDERNYQYPENLNRAIIPREVFDFFDRIHDDSISDDELFKSKLTIDVQGVSCVLGFGGIHGARDNYQEKTTSDRVIKLYDVASFYPSIMINNNYVSRNIPDPMLFSRIYKERVAAKKEGDKHISDTYKLVLNTTYGAMLNQYNALHDPLMGRSVCISGQLYLLELALSYVRLCKSVKLIQLNTDGIMISVDPKDLSTIYAINDEWQERTGFVLEEDKIKKIVQKDVNNYIVSMDNDYIITKGGFLAHGISPFGAWTVNNTFPIVKKAIINYLTRDIAIEETVRASNNIFDFQIIAQAGSKYKSVYWENDGKEIQVQKVNRVYASKNKRYGKLYKVHSKTGTGEKIASLPDHCAIDNRNRLSLADVDKDWYIELAKDRTGDFLGRRIDYVDEYVKLIELEKVTGIGEKTMERIRAECEIYEIEDLTSAGQEQVDLTWLDDVLNS